MVMAGVEAIGISYQDFQRYIPGMPMAVQHKIGRITAPVRKIQKTALINKRSFATLPLDNDSKM